MKKNLTVGANERYETFVMVKLYKISLCKREAGLRSPSVKLKRSVQVKPGCGDDMRTAAVASVMSSLDYECNSQLTTLCLFPQLLPLYAFLYNSFLSVQGCLPPATETDVMV